MSNELKQKWIARLRPLVGRTIAKVAYLTDKDCEELGWDAGASVVLQLDDGTVLFPSMDDEGNGPGALFIAPSEAAKAAGLPEAAPVI